MIGHQDASVVVVGAGPVGLTLAMDLGLRGVDVVVVERREHAEAPGVKCNHISARSMEILRRLGIADELRDAGLPHDHPHDCAYRTSFLGYELSRTLIPSRNGRRTGAPGADVWWPTPEPPHRVNQVYAEPILARCAAAMPGVRIVHRSEVVDFTQDSDGVSTTIEDLDGGETWTLTSRFLVGCDGPRSMVREQIGAAFSGPPFSGRVQSTLIHAPTLEDLSPHESAWSTSVWNDRRHGNIIAIDGRGQFLVHNLLRPGDDADSIDRDEAIRTILGVDDSFEYELLSIEDYEGRGLIADRMRDRRVFLAGDAAHLWMPFAGYGMNAGIADAADLAWQLAAHLNGWAPMTILDGYERERRPITTAVMGQAMGFLQGLGALSGQQPTGIDDDTPEAEAARAEFGRLANALNTQQYACAGLNFGYCYDDSPLIAYDGEEAPPFTMGQFTPSTVPGCRTPHVWLEDGRSLYDALGDGYALLRTDRGLDVSPLVDAATAQGVPIAIVELTGAEGATHYDHPLVLCRPDQHIAWRGLAMPDDPAGLVEQIRGAAV
jgi:2-polyprenyl-6-methoxyphenol hydroxylase-like FAD-dependent oxidoreductase